MATKPHLGRSAGLVLPLFSLRSARDAGIGEIGALAPLGRWLDRAGFHALQLLPVSTLPAGEASPYSALSAMAIDPVYITLDDVADYKAPGGDVRLPLADQIALRAARSAPRVDYANVRQAKQSALALAFSYFWDVDWVRTTARAGSFAAFCSWEEWWLGDYALYCALRDRYAGRPWTGWPDPLRDRQPEALDAARRRAGARNSLPPVHAVAGRRAVGRPRASNWATCDCSATSRSWSASTAPMSGPTSPCFNSTGQRARRQTRSARPGRTGGCRSTGGT